MTPQRSYRSGRRLSSRAVALCAGISLLAIACLFTIATRDLFGDQTPAPSSVTQSSVHALAHLEPLSGIVTVGARPGARIIKISVSEGDVVRAGDTLAILEGEEQARLQLALAESQKNSALGRRSRARQKAALERKVADAVLDLKRAALKKQADLTEEKVKKAQASYSALSALGALAKMPPKDQIEIESALYQLRMQSLKTELDVKEFEEGQKLHDPQRKLEDQELADGGPDDEILDRQVELARSALDQTVVRAPGPGTVLSIMAHPGEISSGGLLAMGDLSAIVARAEVDQSDVGKLRVGDPARVMNLDKTAGKVTRIGSLVGYNRTRSIDPRAVQDIRAVETLILLEKPEVAGRFIGMQVEVEIEIGSASSGPPAPGHSNP